MHNALFARIHIVQFNAEGRAVLSQRVNLQGRNLIQNMQAPLDRRRHIMVHRCNGAVRPAYLAPGQAQPFKCLRRCDLVDELQIDVEQRRLALRLCYDVLFPNLLEKCFRLTHCSS